MSKISGRERGRQQRTARILQAARAILRNGEELSVERLAERAGVAPATVFNLIGTRDRIWAALVDEALDQLDEQLDAAAITDPAEQARRIVGGLAELFVADPLVYRHIAAHWGQVAGKLGRGPLDRLYDALSAGVEQGVLRNGADIGRLAGSIQTACIGALHQWGAGLVGDSAFRDRCVLGVDLAFAAAAADSSRDVLARTIDRR